MSASTLGVTQVELDEDVADSLFDDWRYETLWFALDDVGDWYMRASNAQGRPPSGPGTYGSTTDWLVSGGVLHDLLNKLRELGRVTGAHEAPAE